MLLSIWQVPLSPSLSIRSTRSSLLSLWQTTNTSSLSYPGSISTLQCCYNLVCWDLDHLSPPKDITLVHYIDDIMLIWPSEQEVATILDLLVRHLCAIVWDINPTKIHEPSTSVKFLGVQLCVACWDIPSKVEDKLLYLASPTTKKEAQCLVGLSLWNLKITNSSFGPDNLAHLLSDLNKC